jgi:hypothetical protein
MMLIVDVTLFRLLPISGYVTLDSVDWGKTFEQTCGGVTPVIVLSVAE